MTPDHTWVYAVDDFSVSVATGQGVVRVGLAGELDFASRHLLERVACHVLLLGPSVVEIDLRRLRFCDVAGERQIVDLYRRWRDEGLSVSLHGARPAIRKVFYLTGQADLLHSGRLGS